MDHLRNPNELIDNIVCEVKSQGVFDEFRKECMADVDTKPAYQNLRQRVENSVSKFLNDQEWKPELNKNQLRERLRRNITDTGYLETGVERIVDQVVNPKINKIFLPKIEEIYYQYIGIEKPKPTEIIDTDANANNDEYFDKDEQNLLPTDLEAVSPDSDKSNQKAKDFDTEFNSNFDDDKDEDFESPAFEPLESRRRSESEAPKNDTDDNSKLSAISGLTSQDSIENDEDIEKHVEHSNQNDTDLLITTQLQSSSNDLLLDCEHSELSQVSSSSRLSIVTDTNSNDQTPDVDISEEAQMPKFNDDFNTNMAKNDKMVPLITTFEHIKNSEIKFEKPERKLDHTFHSLSHDSSFDNRSIEYGNLKNDFNESLQSLDKTNIDDFSINSFNSKIVQEEKQIINNQKKEQLVNIVDDVDSTIDKASIELVKSESSSYLMHPIINETENLSLSDYRKINKKENINENEELIENKDIDENEQVRHEAINIDVDVYENVEINKTEVVKTEETKEIMEMETAIVKQSFDIKNEEETKNCVELQLIESSKIEISENLNEKIVTDENHRENTKVEKCEYKDKNENRHYKYQKDDKTKDRYSSSHRSKDKYSSERHRKDHKDHQRSRDENHSKSSHSKHDDKSRHKMSSSSSRYTSSSSSSSSSKSKSNSASSSHHNDKHEKNENDSASYDRKEKDTIRRHKYEKNDSKRKQHRSEDSNNGNYKLSENNSKTKKEEDDHYSSREKPKERRRSNDRDSNDERDSKLTNNNNSSSSSNNNNSNSNNSNNSNNNNSSNNDNNCESQSGDTSEPSSPSTTSATSHTDELNDSSELIIDINMIPDNKSAENKFLFDTLTTSSDNEDGLPINYIAATSGGADTLQKMSTDNVTADDEDYIFLPTQPVVIDQILTRNDKNVELLIEQNKGHNNEHHHREFFSSIEKSLNNTGNKSRKPKFASNIFEAKKLMKVRKQIDREDKKRMEKALVMAKQYISKNNSISIPNGMGLDEQGVEIEFVCLAAATTGNESSRLFNSDIVAVIQNNEPIQENDKVKEIQLIKEVDEVKEIQVVKEIDEVKELDEVKEIDEANKIDELKEVDKVKKTVEVKDIDEVKEIDVEKEIDEVKELHEAKLIDELKAIDEVKEPDEVKEIIEVKDPDEIKEVVDVNKSDEVKDIVEVNDKEEPFYGFPDNKNIYQFNEKIIDEYKKKLQLQLDADVIHSDNCNGINEQENMRDLAKKQLEMLEKNKKKKPTTNKPEITVTTNKMTTTTVTIAATTTATITATITAATTAATTATTTAASTSVTSVTDEDKVCEEENKHISGFYTGNYRFNLINHKRNGTLENNLKRKYYEVERDSVSFDQAIFDTNHMGDDTFNNNDIKIFKVDTSFIDNSQDDDASSTSLEQSFSTKENKYINRKPRNNSQINIENIFNNNSVANSSAEKITNTNRQKTQNIGRINQRYDTDDLYKPRRINSSRRRPINNEI